MCRNSVRLVNIQHCVCLKVGALFEVFCGCLLFIWGFCVCGLFICGGFFHFWFVVGFCLFLIWAAIVWQLHFETGLPCYLFVCHLPYCLPGAL